ncbi:hypothetical protein A3709_20735 [Halioglobus sp. HI00S01]|uniref:hypothetical protein n=1 Tax=Halioglobus sp. HI00S01 TaxID=1822214 RepID=UPI0007C2F68C|nr:hypothetical protein [Halioglobus sp. HI00S01]KZX58041.1 hypothetical protein A3709_20735 [Halioglobus sp. HI00S01]
METNELDLFRSPAPKWDPAAKVQLIDQNWTHITISPNARRFADAVCALHPDCGLDLAEVFRLNERSLAEGELTLPGVDRPLSFSVNLTDLELGKGFGVRIVVHDAEDRVGEASCLFDEPFVIEVDGTSYLFLIVEHDHMTPHDYADEPINRPVCPVCREDSIEGDMLEVQGNMAFQPVRCLGCDSTWVDTYVLRGYQHLDPTGGVAVE